ncbi:MAG: alpha-amylase family protein [Burkholderiales bacterium]|nr:alpha-amylase family protein [Burkholderiales bacterium]
MQNWVRHAILWQIYPLGFVGAEAQAGSSPAVAHRLAHLQAWLDYAAELGASALLLGPVFAASTHGYDTIDYFRIDPRLGDESDFDELLQAAHKRGLKILLDGVFNHVGRAFPAFSQVLALGPSAPAASWFRLSWKEPYRSGAEPDYACFEGHRELVALNHDEPAVADYVARVMNHWLDRGIDGWRLDAAYAVPARFWAKVLPQVRARHAKAYIFGEVIHGDYAAIVNESSFDAVTQYELHKAIWSSLQERNFFELAWALDRHNGFLDSFVPLTFIGNHDVTRLASRIADQRHLPHALAILLTCGGTPSIYAGDEQAFCGIKEHKAGGDDAIRPMFPPTPEGLAPQGWPTYRLHQQLIGMRLRNAWLHEARTKAIVLQNDHFIYAAQAGDHCLLVALNLGDRAVTMSAPRAREVLANEARLTRPGKPDAMVELPPHGWAILAC